MPRLVDALPKYRKHKASGHAIVTLNGGDHYLGPQGRQANRVQYERLIVAFSEDLRDPSHGSTHYAGSYRAQEAAPQNVSDR